MNNCLSIPQWCDCCGLTVGDGINAITTFQSHNGAIAAVISFLLNEREPYLSIPQWCDCCLRSEQTLRSLQHFFQSHNGAIAAKEIGGRRLASLAAFNPTMVRLLREAFEGYKRWEIGFQSHNGAIAACWCPSSSIGCSGFQSHNGAIAASNSSATCSPVRSSFNPTMVRLLPRQNFGV